MFANKISSMNVPVPSLAGFCSFSAAGPQGASARGSVERKPGLSRYTSGSPPAQCLCPACGGMSAEVPGSGRSLACRRKLPRRRSLGKPDLHRSPLRERTAAWKIPTVKRDRKSQSVFYGAHMHVVITCTSHCYTMLCRHLGTCDL